MICFRRSGTKLYAELPLQLSERERGSLLTISLKDAKFNAMPKARRIADFKRRRTLVEEGNKRAAERRNEREPIGEQA